MFRLINENIEDLLFDMKKWINYLATVYNKTTEFEWQRNAKYYNDMNPDLVAAHVNEYMKARKFIASFLRNVEDPTITDAVEEAIENIKQEDEATKEEFKKNAPFVAVREKREKQVSIMKLRGREIVRLV
jgi:hypothetical protein